jgi:hypothetical protein
MCGGSQLCLGLGDTGGGEEFFVDDDEEAVSAGEDGAVSALEFSLMEELAAWRPVPFRGTAEMTADEYERLTKWGGAEVVDLHVAGHGKDVEGPVKLAHGFVEEGGDDAAVDVAGRAFVETGEVDLGPRDGGFGVADIRGENEVEALRVSGTAAETVAGPFVDGGVGFQ